MDNGLYHLVSPPVDSVVVVVASLASSGVVAKPNLWHSRLGHLSKGSLKIISTADPIVTNDHKDPCDFCYYAKQKMPVFSLNYFC